LRHNESAVNRLKLRDVLSERRDEFLPHLVDPRLDEDLVEGDFDTGQEI
jgi:hypothetical protein